MIQRKKFSDIVYHSSFKVFLGIASLVFLVGSLRLFCYTKNSHFEKMNETHKLTMQDVGQGDSFLIEFAGMQKLLVDTGDDVLKFYEAQRKSKDRTPIWDNVVLDFLDQRVFDFEPGRIDLVIITHDDSDHVGILRDIVRTQSVGAVISSALAYTHIDKIFETHVTTNQKTSNLKTNISNEKPISIAHQQEGRGKNKNTFLLQNAENNMIISFDSGSVTSFTQQSHPQFYQQVVDNLIKIFKDKFSLHESVGESLSRDKTFVDEQNTNAKIIVLHPNKIDIQSKLNKSKENQRSGNEDSIVFELVFNPGQIPTTALFTGDAGVVSEKSIISNIKSNPWLQKINSKKTGIDFLKVGHHGSKTSTSDEFAKFLNPKYALISVGYKNTYGHPHKSVLKTLAKYISVDQIIRTDTCGTIQFEINKNGTFRHRLCIVDKSRD